MKLKDAKLKFAQRALQREKIHERMGNMQECARSWTTTDTKNERKERKDKFDKKKKKKKKSLENLYFREFFRVKERKARSTAKMIIEIKYFSDERMQLGEKEPTGVKQTYILVDILRNFSNVYLLTIEQFVDEFLYAILNLKN